MLPTERFRVNDKILKSLNEIKSYRFEERMDFFLFELKCWYCGINKVSASKNIFQGNRESFMQFGKL